MTDPEVEELLRETFRSREAQAPHLSRVRPTPRRTPYVAAGLATLALLAGAVVAANAMRGPAPPTVDVPVAVGPPEPGWRWESSLGAQIQVPDSWTVNQWGCGGQKTGQPTVARGKHWDLTCYMEEPYPKDVAIIATPGRRLESEGFVIGFPARSVTIDGVPATRVDGPLPEGGYSGMVTVPSRNVAVAVRTQNGDAKQILDSLRLADVDYYGCPARLEGPPVTLPALSGKPALPDGSPRIGLCLYEVSTLATPAPGGPRLEAAAELTGSAADEVLTFIREAAEGRNPDPPATRCTPHQPTQPDLVIRPYGGPPLSLVFSTCSGRGLTDGEHWAQIRMALLWKVFKPLGTGFMMATDLPE